MCLSFLEFLAHNNIRFQVPMLSSASKHSKMGFVLSVLSLFFSHPHTHIQTHTHTCATPKTCRAKTELTIKHQEETRPTTTTTTTMKTTIKSRKGYVCNVTHTHTLSGEVR